MLTAQRRGTCIPHRHTQRCSWKRSQQQAGCGRPGMMYQEDEMTPRPCVRTPSSCEGTRPCMSGLFESSSGVRNWNLLFRERSEQHDPRIRKSVWPGALIRRNRGEALQVSPDDKIHISLGLNFRPYTPERDMLPKDKRKFSFPWHSRLLFHSRCERRVETLHDNWRSKDTYLIWKKCARTGD